HTFMAAEALTKAAEKMDVDIKVETHGQVGVENELSAEEIREADGVIIAADKDVNSDRFHGKPLVNVSVSRGIKASEELIKQIINEEASIHQVRGYEASKEKATSNTESSQKDNKGNGLRSIYNNLMNGVSHMLPVVVGGGVLTALSFLFGIHSANPDHESYNEFAAFLNNVGGLAFSLMVPILAAFIAESIAKRP